LEFKLPLFLLVAVLLYLPLLLLLLLVVPIKTMIMILLHPSLPLTNTRPKLSLPSFKHAKPYPASHPSHLTSIPFGTACETLYSSPPNAANPLLLLRYRNPLLLILHPFNPPWVKYAMLSWTVAMIGT
jgi:hypothetical protein